MNAPPYTLTNESITVVWKGKPNTVQKNTPNFLALRQAILDERWDDIPKHLTITKSIQEWAKGKFTYNGTRFSHDGEEIPEDINERIIKMASANEDPTPLFKFWERLKKNPSWRSVKQLFTFLKHVGIPLTEDGCFLAYKGVKENYKDCHSGKFDNSPGACHHMQRNKISDDPNEACHEGFHVGALSYAENFCGNDGRVVVCKVDPENVVCVPYDESQRKMRVCEYTVIGNHGTQLPDTTFNLSEDQSSDYDDYEESDHEGENEDDDGYDEGDEGDEEDEEGDESEEEPEHEEKVPDKQEPKKPAIDMSKVKLDFSKLNKMKAPELMECSIDILRKYAVAELKIVGASKIPGGKTALVSKILKTRRK
jgi:hypothetical protein